MRALLQGGTSENVGVLVQGDTKHREISILIKLNGSVRALLKGECIRQREVPIFIKCNENVRVLVKGGTSENVKGFVQGALGLKRLLPLQMQ